MALPDLLARPERVGDEPCEEVGPVLRVELLPDLPELGDVGAVGLRLDVVDAMPAGPLAPVAVGRVDERARGQDQPLHLVRPETASSIAMTAPVWCPTTAVEATPRPSSSAAAPRA